MRIVAGALRGRPIEAPAGPETRPTSDRARQAVFNILEHAPWAAGVEDLRVIDLFAGSGAMGLEALSRGARACLFMETATPALDALRANVDRLGLTDRARLLRQDATRLASRTPTESPFDLALLDPPYAKGLGEKALQALLDGGWLSPDALAVVERGSAEPPAATPGWRLLDERRYGAATILFLTPV